MGSVIIYSSIIIVLGIWVIVHLNNRQLDKQAKEIHHQLATTKDVDDYLASTQAREVLTDQLQKDAWDSSFKALGGDISRWCKHPARSIRTRTDFYVSGDMALTCTRCGQNFLITPGSAQIVPDYPYQEGTTNG